MSIFKLAKFYQVVIIGAGPVGGVLALALSKSPYIENVLLIQRQKKPKFQFAKIPDQRVYSINSASFKLWNSLDLIKNIDNQRIGLMNEIKVWNNEGSVTFAEKQMSRVIQNNNILLGIKKSLDQSNKVTTLYEQQIDNYKIDTDTKQISIKLKSGNQIDSKLLIGSDGNKSKVKQLSRIKTYGWSYNQMGIVCSLQLDQNIKTAFQQYYSNNVLALLPLWDNFASIVWSVQFPLYQFLMKKKQQDFQAQLIKTLEQSHLNISLPKIINIKNKRLAFPLSSLQSQRYISERIALIGDAAHSIHPMAGLGVNSGFGDAALLANNIILNKKCGNDIGQQIGLKNYEIEAKKLNYSNSIAMQSLKKIFEIENPIINRIRKLSLSMMDNSQLLKNKLVQSARESTFFPKRFEWEQV